LQVYVHLVWATWDRCRVITPRIEAEVRPALLGKAKELLCTTLAIGGIEDHVHQLLAMPATIPLARIAQELKGSSAHHVNARFGDRVLKWQAGYGAFSVSKRDVERVAVYVRRQREHHGSGRLCVDLEQIHPDLPTVDSGSESNCTRAVETPAVPA
jgi:REP element-mobilizing transposase RayT